MAMRTAQARARSISDRLVSELFPVTRPTSYPPGAVTEGSPSSPDERGWNVWIDSRGVTSSDHRFGLDFNGRLGDIYAGFDFRVQPGLVFGLAVGGEFWDASEFQSTLRSSVDSFVIGPYAAIPLTDWLMFDSWLAYASGRQRLDIADFSGDRDLQRVFGSFNLTAQAWLEEWRIRPKLSAYVSSVNTSSFSLTDYPNFIGSPNSLLLRSSRDGVALTEASVEVAYPFRFNQNTVIVPSIRPGIAVDLNRSNKGRVMTGALQVQQPARTWGSLRAGLQINIGDYSDIDLSAGYDSIGQPGLNVWTGRIAAHLAF